MTISIAYLAFVMGEDSEPAPNTATLPPSGQTLQDEVTALERLRITEALDRTGHNHAHTARELGLSRIGLLKKIDRMGLR